MSIISNILNASLNYLFSITGDLGIAIILLTLTVRLFLVPLSFKQKKGLQDQQKLSEGLKEIQEKYKNNNKQLEIETQKYYKENAKGMLGCLTTFLQLPIVFALYQLILKLPINAGTILVPWVASLKMADSFFVIPVFYMISVLMPNIIPYIPFLRITTQAKVSKVNIIVSSVISALIAFKVPIAIGLYLITTSLFSFLEEVAFRLYSKRTTATA